MERREVAKADPKSSFISEAAVRFRRIKEAALELLQQPGFEYTHENLRSFCSFKHIPFDPSHTKTNFRDAIAGLKQEGFADTFLEQRASVILSAIKAETEAKRARNESRTLQYKRSRMERQTRFQNEGNSGNITIYSGENIYNGRNYSVSGSGQDGSGMAKGKSGGQPAAEGVRSRASKEARSHPPKAGRAASAASTAATCAKEDEEPDLESPPAKRTRSEDHPFVNQNASNPAKPPNPHHNTQNKGDSSHSNHRRVLGELKSNILVEEGSALPPEHKGLDISKRQLALGDINVTLAAAEAALDAAVEECDEAEQAYNKVLRTGSSTKALEDAFRHRKRARAEKQRLLDDMQALGKRVPATASEEGIEEGGAGVPKVHFDPKPANGYNGLERPSHVATEPVHGRPPVPLPRASPTLPATASGALRRPSDLSLKTPPGDEPAKPPKHNFAPAAATAPNTKAERQALSGNEHPKSKQRPSQLSSKSADGHRSLADSDRAGADRQGKRTEGSASLGMRRGQPQPVAVDDKVETRPSDVEDDVEGGDQPGLEQHESQPVDKMDEEMEQGEIAEEGGETEGRMELMAGMRDGEVVKFLEAAPIGDMNGLDMIVDGNPQQPGVVFNSLASDTPQLASPALEGASLALANIETVDKQQIDSPALEKTAELHALEEQQKIRPDSPVKNLNGSLPTNVLAAAEPVKDGSMGDPNVSLLASISKEKALGLAPLTAAYCQGEANEVLMGGVMAGQVEAVLSASNGAKTTAKKVGAASRIASSLEKITNVTEHFSVTPRHSFPQEQQVFKPDSPVKSNSGTPPIGIPAAAEPAKDGSMGGPGVPLVASSFDGKALGLAPLTAVDPQGDTLAKKYMGLEHLGSSGPAIASEPGKEWNAAVTELENSPEAGMKRYLQANAGLSIEKSGVTSDPLQFLPDPAEKGLDEKYDPISLPTGGAFETKEGDAGGLPNHESLMSPRPTAAGVEGGAGAEELAEVWSGQKRWEALFERFFCTPPRPEEIRAQVLKDREQQNGLEDFGAAPATVPVYKGALNFPDEDPLFTCDDISSYVDEEDLVPTEPAKYDQEVRIAAPTSKQALSDVPVRANFGRATAGNAANGAQGKMVTPHIPSSKGLTGAGLAGQKKNSRNNKTGKGKATLWNTYDNPEFEFDGSQ